MFKELLISGAIVLLSGYRYYMHKSEDIECVSYEVKSRKIPKVFDKFKIVQISDLHNRSFGIDNSILLEKIDKLKPDIVCITGDLIDGANEDFSIALKLIDELSRKYQVYHIIGNHEQKVMFNKYKELYKEYFKQLNTKNIINLENEMVKILSYEGDVFGIEPPLFVELEITETEPGFAGNTATGATKPATVETGAQVLVPLFINQGEVIKIDTRTGEYLGRSNSWYL